jgi:hypothetical protein
MTMKINQPENGYYFYQVPKILWENENYNKCLDPIDIMIYMLLMDRYNQFIIKPDPRFIDDNGEMFIIYPENELGAKIQKDQNYVSKSVNKLKRIGLINFIRAKKYPNWAENKEVINRYYLFDIPLDSNKIEVEKEINKINKDKEEIRNNRSIAAKKREEKKRMETIVKDV